MFLSIEKIRDISIIQPLKHWVLLLPRVWAIGNNHLISWKAIIDSITFCKFEPFIG